MSEMIIFIPNLTEHSGATEVLKAIALTEKKYGLSHGDLSVKCGYRRNGKTVAHVVWNPEKYLNPKFIRNLIQGIQNLKREKEDVVKVELVNGMKELPETIRFTAPLKKCLGHKKYCTVVDKQGFCGEECKELFKGNKKK